MSLPNSELSASNMKKAPPNDPSDRIPDDQILIVPCTTNDAEMLADFFYTCFATTFWDRAEPPSLRPPPQTRLTLMAKRLLPSLTDPALKWIKALHTQTGECMGMACWTVPGATVHNPFIKSAIKAYAWDAKMGWTPAEIEDMFAHVSEVEWDAAIVRNDVRRAEYFKGEGHWFLAPVCTWPKWQGKGVGRKLLAWGIEQADETVPATPVYLESAPTARGFYERLGFEAVGEKTFVRRGKRE